MEQNNPTLTDCSAARIMQPGLYLKDIKKFDHISPVLRELHWLPVEHRISYKILLLTYKALNGHAPQYLAALISKYVPPRPLRSEDHYLLNSPRWRLSQAKGGIRGMRDRLWIFCGDYDRDVLTFVFCESLVHLKCITTTSTTIMVV